MLRRAKRDRWLYEEIELTRNAFETLEIEAERPPQSTEVPPELLAAAKARVAKPYKARANKEPKRKSAGRPQ